MNRVSDKIKAVLGGSIFLLALALGGPAAAQDGLIGYWPFDGNGADLSDEGRNLDLAGGVGFAPGLFGQALDLHNKGAQFAARPVDDVIYDFGGNDFTVQIWVNFNNSDPSREQTLIEKFSGCCGPGWTLTYVRGALHFYANPTIIIESAPLETQSGVWHHILARRSGTLYQIFYDSDVVVEGNSMGFIPDTTMPLLIGKRNDPDGRIFAVDGRIDEVAIWSRALSDDEIAFLFNDGSGNPVASLGVVPVVIDIKPGSFPNSINPRSKGVIPVAILTDTFDATTVDPLSVKFGPAGATESHGRGHIEDADGDGDQDLVLHFRTQDTGIQCGNTSASLIGNTFDGAAIEGSDLISTVGCK